MKALSIFGLILGILAIVFCWADWFFIGGIVGIVLSAIGRSKAKAAGASTGLATAGLVLSIIGTCLGGIFFCICTLPALCIESAGEAAFDAAMDAAEMYY